MSHSTIVGDIVIQKLGKDNNTVISTKNMKAVEISTVKDDEETVFFIRIIPTNSKVKCSPFGYPLIEVQFFDRFVHEGKATIKICRSSVQVLINNCPPSDLKLFLMTIKVKLNKCAMTISQLVRTKSMDKLRPSSIEVFSVVSPVKKKDTFHANDNLLEKNFKEIKPITNPDRKRPLSSVLNDIITPPNKKMKLQMTSTPNLEKKPLNPNINLNDSLNGSIRITEYFQLTKEQIDIMERVKAGENVFFTGSAGTGKTFLLKKIIGCLAPQFTAITASTGIAASLIDGCTLHSFAGIGVESRTIDEYITILKRKPNVIKQWRKCKYLVIDEVSLLSAEYFDNLDKVVRHIKERELVPFGGIQLILTGDFLQLPPILSKQQNENKTYKFLFQSRVWNEAFKEIHVLTDVKRQSDKKFVDLLSKIRVGQCPDWIDKVLRATANQNTSKDGIIPTQLCTHKVDVEHQNERSLQNLKGEGIEFVAFDSVPDKESFLKNATPAEHRLVLKVGAQVMLLKNLDVLAGLANGSRGVVLKFQTESGGRYPVVKFISGQTLLIKPENFTVTISVSGGPLVVVRKQLPLKLAYAISVHKSQGMTLDCVDLYLSKTFECGQAYVALSRCKSLEAMRVFDWTNRCIKTDKEVLKFYGLYRSFSERNFELNLSDD